MNNIDINDAKTVGVKACASCGSGLLESDKFCRRCGIPQLDQFATSSHTSLCSQTLARQAITESVVSATDVYHPVSGPLVKAVVASVSTSATGPLRTGFLKSSILALISVPIWMIIILLSPIDAYVASRTLARAI